MTLGGGVDRWACGPARVRRSGPTVGPTATGCASGAHQEEDVSPQLLVEYVDDAHQTVDGGDVPTRIVHQAPGEPELSVEL